MKPKEIIGIDVSKLTLDVCIHSNQKKNRFDNNEEGFSILKKWVFSSTSFSEAQTLFVFEHTGLYSIKISQFLASRGLEFVIVPGLEIKRSLGIVRGKDDQVDAKRIALYGYRLREELTPTELNNSYLDSIKTIHNLRKKLITQRAGFKTSLKEQMSVLDPKQYKTVFTTLKKLIQMLSKEIKKLELEIIILIEEQEDLKKNFNLILSIKGVGVQTAISVLVATANFTKFNNWRKFASYCGVAPFAYQSGTSIRGKTKVSHLARKDLKSILTMCAISAIQFNAELKSYYQKRVSQGKSKMSTINIIRNKLIARIFAVVNRGAEYVNILKYAS